MLENVKRELKSKFGYDLRTFFCKFANMKFARYLLVAFFAIFAMDQTDAVEDVSAGTFDFLFSNVEDPTNVFLLPDDKSEAPSFASPIASEVIDYAAKFLGRPYRRGAKGPKSFDCSGFTSFIFRNFDILLNPSSSAQYTQGVSISNDEIRPGDLLFFGGRRSGKTRVGHVGMAVDVDDAGVVTFIHAATSGGIRYDRYPDGGYYSNRYIGARRVLD